MGCIKLTVHPLFFLFGLYYSITGRIFVFIIYTVSAILHELGHSFVAQSLGYRLKRITLMPFGAVISGDTENLKPSDQLKIALAGPFLNLGVGLFFVAIWWVFPETYAYTDLVAEANFSLALVNFLPVFPLDGGRILQSFLALRVGKRKAVIVCRMIGVGVAVMLFVMFVWSCFIGFNLSLLFFSLFVIASAFDKNKENAYARVYTVFSPERLKRGVDIRRQGVDKDITVKKMIAILDGDAINELVVYGDGTPIAVLNQEKINQIIEKGTIYDKISSHLSV